MRTSRSRSRAPSHTLALDYVVVTSVDRDDLADCGASHFARTIAETRARIPSCRLEVLIPDFKGDESALRIVLDARPDVLNHNIETVPRLYRTARPGGRYDRAPCRCSTGPATYAPSNPDQVRADGRARRGVGRGRRDAARPAIGRVPDRHDRPVPAAVARQPPDGALLHARTSSPSSSGSRSRWASATSSPGPLVRSSYHAHEQTQSYEAAIAVTPAVATGINHDEH